MIHVTDSIVLDESEINLKFIRSPGPGGQHVNKASTAVELRFDVRNSRSLPNQVRHRLLQLAGNRISGDGILVINANRFRSQDLNRKDAIARLKKLIEASARQKKPRRKTKPTLASVKKRKKAKQQRSKLKRSRQPVDRQGE